MSGPAPRRVGALEFGLAGPADAPQLCRLLRDQALPGWVHLGFEREPDFFHAAHTEGDRHQVLLAREAGSGRVVAMHSRSVREVYVDGQVRRLPYLGQLRTDPALPPGRWRYRLLREGFAAGRRMLHQDDELPYALTAILHDNLPARRVLEAGLPGLPRYTPIAPWSTLAFACRGQRRAASRYQVRPAGEQDLPAILDLLARHQPLFQLAPVWQEADLRSPLRCRGLEVGDFLLAERAGTPVGCVALWDQRAFKQTVVRGYRFPLEPLRPALNLAAPLTGLPPLPPPGRVLAQAWLSHLAHPGGGLELVRALVAAGLRLARERGLDQALLGLADAHPACGHLQRHFRALRYRSILYLVHWEDEAVRLPATGRRLVHVETAVI